MVLFFFKIGNAFLNSVRHPMTIPKKHYDQLLNEELISGKYKNTDVTIICPDGRKLPGQIYSGKAGYGHYYQIRVRGGYPTDYLGHLNKDEPVAITIEKADKKILVRIHDHIEEKLEKLLNKE